MTSPFPFGFETPTAFYLTLYVATLVVHFIFMNYVLAGSAMLAGRSVLRLFGGSGGHLSQPASLVRDWLPLAIGAAITAGVAPLLFLQILYRTNFYTSVLLLEHRFMAFLPVLIVGFYLAYLLKAKHERDRPRWIGAAIAVIAFGSFLFTAHAWTGAHDLSLQSQSKWSSFYEKGQFIYFDLRIPARLGIAFFAAFPTMLTIVGWQMLDAGHLRVGPSERTEARPMSIVAISALLGAIACAGLYRQLLEPSLHDVLLGSAGIVYTITLGVGLLMQFGAWLLVLKQRSINRALMTLSSLGVVLMLLGMTVLRELLRVTQVDLEELAPLHAASFRRGGFIVFLGFVLINILVIGGAILLVRRGIRPINGNSDQSND